jgi:hypothetical protein
MLAHLQSEDVHIANNGFGLARAQHVNAELIALMSVAVVFYRAAVYFLEPCKI